MRKLFLIAALAAFAATGAASQNLSNPDIVVPKALTVIEAINLGSALRNLGDHPEINDKGMPTGKTVTVPFKFGGGTLLAMAVNIGLSDQQVATYREAYKKLRQQYVDEKTQEVPDGKLVELAAENEKQMTSMSGLTFRRLKLSELCMTATPEGKPVSPCTAVNMIPPFNLAPILPIVDADK